MACSDEQITRGLGQPDGHRRPSHTKRDTFLVLALEPGIEIFNSVAVLLGGRRGLNGPGLLIILPLIRFKSRGRWRGIKREIRSPPLCLRGHA